MSAIEQFANNLQLSSRVNNISVIRDKLSVHVFDLDTRHHQQHNDMIYGMRVDNNNRSYSSDSNGGAFEFFRLPVALDDVIATDSHEMGGAILLSREAIDIGLRRYSKC